jgi:hypothetical protein
VFSVVITATMPADVLQSVSSMPKVSRPPLWPLATSEICVRMISRTSGGATPLILRTMSSIRFSMGKKLARATEKSRAGNSARKK